MFHATATRVAGVAVASLLAAATQAVAQQPTPADRPDMRPQQHRQTQVQPSSMDRHNVRTEDRGMTRNQRFARDVDHRTMRSERFARDEGRTLHQDHGTVRNGRFARDEGRRTLRQDRGVVRNERFARDEERRTIRRDRVGEERFGQERVGQEHVGQERFVGQDRVGQAPVGYENGTYGTEEARARVPRDRTHIVGWTTPAPAYANPGWNGDYAYNYGTPYYDYNGYYNGGPNPVGAVIGGALDAATLGIFGNPYYDNGYNYPPPGPAW
jgi:hypothetical protein